MLRVIVILIAVLVAVSAGETIPDPSTALTDFKNAPIFAETGTYILQQPFIVGIAVGILAGEVLRVLWRVTRVTSEFVAVIGMRAIQYAAVLSVIGLVIYFI